MNKITEKSKVFYKLYAVNIMITVVFICLISLVCSSFSSKLILNNFIAFNKDMIAEKGNVLDDRVRHLDEAVNQIVREEPVFRFIMTNGDDLYNRISFPVDDVDEDRYHTCYNIMYVLYHSDAEKFLQYCEKIKEDCDNMSRHRIEVLVEEIVKK